MGKDEREGYTIEISRDGTITVDSLEAFQCVHKALTEGFYIVGPDSKTWIQPKDIFITPEGDIEYKRSNQRSGPER